VNHYYLDACAWGILMYIAVQHGDYTTFSVIALLVSAVCFVLWMTARLQLGASFRVRAQAHKLVTRGLYRKIRNPIYAFSFGAFLSVLVAIRTWAGIAVFVAFYSFQLIRIRREEKVLEDAFGEEYRDYRRQTWF